MTNVIADPVVLPDYPNVLTEPHPKRFELARRPLVLLGLVLLCFLPRAVIAVKCPSIGADATLYIKLAKAIDQGDFHVGLSDMRLNTYPVILAGIHRLGFDWETGGRWWGVVIASLVVLPLYGWIRRQFDDYVALAACFLYAVHPRFIEWSPHVMRDPTFWFLLALSLYFLWRAVCEVRPGMFAAAGIASTLAVMTRREGLFLLIPLLLWSLWRWLALQESRRRLVIGVLLFSLIPPAIFIFVNLIMLRGHSTWEFCRLPEFSMIENLEESVGIFNGESPDEDAVEASKDSLQAGADHIPRMRIGKMTYKYLSLLESGFTAVFGILLVGGLWVWRKIWLRRDNRPLLYFSIVIMVGIWLDYWQLGQTSTRYPLTIALMATPFAGLALLRISQWSRNSARKANHGLRWQKAALFVPAILIAIASFPEALIASSKRFETLAAYSSLGHWVKTESKVKPVVLGHESVAKIVKYRADCKAAVIHVLDSPSHIAKVADNRRINVVMLSKTKLRHFDSEKLFTELEKIGYKRVNPSELPPGTDRVVVFMRNT
ncbi:MAG: glycosyltransferase family 39 protein [Pirellulales bacterium]|nr:glycosyltransferase family 39 protein [Pirellulales bacterium]